VWLTGNKNTTHYVLDINVRKQTSAIYPIKTVGLVQREHHYLIENQIVLATIWLTILTNRLTTITHA
jgi:hypothetical protein